MQLVERRRWEGHHIGVRDVEVRDVWGGGARRVSYPL